MRRLKSLALLFLVVVACAPSSPAKRRPSRIEVEAGRFIPGYGFSIDAGYDPRFDNLIPGYKLLTVVIRNTSLSVIDADAKRDRWVVVDVKGKRYSAINSLKYKDRPLWRDLPEKLKGLIDYPEEIPISYTVTFDLLFPRSLDLRDFQAVHYKNAAWGQEFIVTKE